MYHFVHRELTARHRIKLSIVSTYTHTLLYIENEAKFARDTENEKEEKCLNSTTAQVIHLIWFNSLHISLSLARSNSCHVITIKLMLAVMIMCFCRNYFSFVLGFNLHICVAYFIYFSVFAHAFESNWIESLASITMNRGKKMKRLLLMSRATNNSNRLTLIFRLGKHQFPCPTSNVCLNIYIAYKI